MFNTQPTDFMLKHVSPEMQEEERMINGEAFEVSKLYLIYYPYANLDQILHKFAAFQAKNLKSKKFKTTTVK